MRLVAGEILIDQTSAAGSTTNATATSLGPVATDASAVSLATRYEPSAGGFLTIYPADIARPDTSNVNADAGIVVAAHAVTGLDATGKLSVYSLSQADVEMFVTGYYTTSLQPQNPPDVLDPVSYTWDTENRLGTSTDSDGNTSTNSYRSDGLRVAQEFDDGSAVVYQGSLEIDINADGSFASARRTYSHQGAAVASRQVGLGGDETSWLLGNHQGSLTTTVTGSQVTTRNYFPYGGQRGAPPASEPTTTGFLNQHEDSTGLTYLNNRHYDPGTGVFISVDPLVMMTSEPYIYGSANPVKYSDPSGLCGEGDPRAGALPCTGQNRPRPTLEEQLPDRHRSILEVNHPTDPTADPTGRIKIFDLIPVGPGTSRAAEVEICDWSPQVCLRLRAAAAVVGEILPDAGDDTRNNARRHALWSALYWLQSGDTLGPDAHENVVDGRLDGYLNDQRLMDLINNEVGFEIAQQLEASGSLPTLMPASETDPFLYTLDASAVLGAPAVRDFLLGATEQAANDGRLVWLR